MPARGFEPLRVGAGTPAARVAYSPAHFHPATGQQLTAIGYRAKGYPMTPLAIDLPSAVEFLVT
ncbi:MAG: hypothetical protein KC519_14760, partial [Anaerolineae bacterium]|nr:hypothetical protein [Anaerolineae bacterium]